MSHHDQDPYVLADAEHDKELSRVRTIEANFDAKTRRHLIDLGVAPGFHCLEVGAGGGSVARWLAEQVGPSGRVVATDINTRYIEPMKRPNLEVRTHNILTDELEEGAFDIVHCRTLLIHFREPERALKRMIRALRRGGALLVEEPAAGAGQADPMWPRAEAYNRAAARNMAFLASIGVDMATGSRLPGMLRRLGLVEVSGELTSRVIQSADTRLMSDTANTLRAALIAKGAATDAELDDFISMLNDPDFIGIEPPVLSAWGRRAG